MPESWLKNAIKMASRIGLRRRLVQKCADEAFSEDAAIISSASASISAFGGIGFDALQDFQTACAIALPAQKPARTFGKAEAEQSVEKRGERGHTKHPAPGILADACEQRIGHESDQDAKNNVELKHAGKSSTVFGRRNFRDVKRSNYGGDADAQTADDTRER